jgi:hypothetical protein
MGSSGTGKFTDYSNSQKGSGGHGASGEDPCQVNKTINLEDVERCQFFQAHHELPPANTIVEIVLTKRLCATLNGEILGYLPTELNFLAGCINSGMRYIGIVSSTSIHPLPRIQITVTTNK